MMSLDWIELCVYTDEPGLEIAYGALSGVGIEQVLIEQGEEALKEELKLLAPYWDYADAKELSCARGPCIKAYLPDTTEGKVKLAMAEQALEAISKQGLAKLSVELSTLLGETLEKALEQDFEPFEVGEKLFILAPWVKDYSIPERISVIIDPGLAFGTGEHPSTKLCLNYLEQNIKGGERVLDLGCGSGILSIAAILLGACSAECVDIDPAALKATNNNAKLNGIHSISTHEGDIITDESLRSSLGGGYSIVLANIVADVIVALSPYIGSFLSENGIFICSGIIDERADNVKKALTGAGFTIHEERQSGTSPCSSEGVWRAMLAKQSD